MAHEAKSSADDSSTPYLASEANGQFSLSKTVFFSNYYFYTNLVEFAKKKNEIGRGISQIITNPLTIIIIIISIMKASLLFLWLWKLQHEEDKRRQQEYDPRFISLLDLTGRQRRDRHIARPSLPMPEESPWHRLLSRGNDGCLITATGLDNQSFYALHRLFEPVQVCL